MLMQLGDYQFELNTAIYTKLRRRYTYLWAKKNRYGKHQSKQFTGFGDKTISLSGDIFPDFAGGYDQIEQMDKVASNGEPLLMVAADGWIYGFWVIESLDAEDQYIVNGGLAQKQSFTMELSFYADRLA